MNDGRRARHRSAFTLAANQVRVQADQPEPGWSFSVGTGLTLLRNSRENYHTALSLTLAGRRRPSAGSVTLEHRGKTVQKHTDLFRMVALAGAAEVDSLDRIVPVRAVLREQVNWASPWWKRVGKDLLDHDLVRPWLQPLGLDIDLRTKVGEIDPHDRFRLRVLLALVSRADAAVLIVDDIDQVRDMELRDEILTELRELSLSLPVVASTVNPDFSGIATRVIDLRTMGEEHEGGGRRAVTSTEPTELTEATDGDAASLAAGTSGAVPTASAAPTAQIPANQDQIPTLSEEN
ncbi:MULTISPECIES: hypothetical protein [unclassified Corynebacterium]|uniref:hypothetical protein n=1 Tax=unclassified Corynebacterium TaxID=2624378 RepID=UPI0029CA8567|nr:MULTISPECIES: hypothetical protein [unclassified Corynebacterium]WPF65179.1 hypothetical protein OLX12_06170 [Corynebacterium sp. 22KM0430]WPF67675.1 hypothetical protein OLW90_06165 [Corynebacterium sp. 21KM1197]